MAATTPSRNRDVLMGTALLLCILTVGLLGFASWFKVPEEWKLVADAMGIMKDVVLIILGGYFGAMIGPPPAGVGPVGTSGPINVTVEGDQTKP